MSKNNQEHRDSTTDFFLNFISKEKEKPKTEEKHITPQSINDEIDLRGRACLLYTSPSPRDCS